MPSRGLLLTAFTALVAFGLHIETEARRAAIPTAASVTSLRASTPPIQGGSFPATWNAGVNCATEPDFQVHAYNPDFFIIRQSKCRTHEAPFLYLLFGDEGSLLFDTGSNANTDLWGTIEPLITRWLDANGRDWTRLIVAHSHSHGDHTQGDAQLIGKPYVTHVVGLTTAEITDFWGFQDYPNDVPTIDLGGRVIDVLGTPGHAAGSISLYDRRTHVLLTGDIVYPGHLFIFGQPSWFAFKRSLRRLAHWANTHPVEWVLGCHIEMSDVPFQPYAYGTLVQPNEHALQFPPSELIEIRDAAQSMLGSPRCEIYDEFVIHPVHLCGISWNG